MTGNDHKMLSAGRSRLAEEAERVAAIKAGASIPEDCGHRIVPAPGRGGFVLVRNVELLPVGSDGVQAVHRGYGGRAAIRRADVFDKMIEAAKRARRPVPLTPGQIAMGRRYHDLVELLSADGTRLSQLQSSGGQTDTGAWMDRRLALSGELDGIRRRIGAGSSLPVRRIRPGDRGVDQRGPITDRAIVDMVCLMNLGIKKVLKSHGWQDDGRNVQACRDALRAALDRMIGYRGEKTY